MTYSTQQAADAIGITRATLQEWMRLRKFMPPPVQLVGNGLAMRIWSEHDIEQLKILKTKIYMKGRGRKAAPKGETK